MVKFNLYLVYEDDPTVRPVAVGCSKNQLLDVLSRHLMLAEVFDFIVKPVENSSDLFHEFTI